MASSSPAATPKRKRGGKAALCSPVKFTFDLSQAESSEDGGSPRSRVALRFRGLALGSGGGVLDDEGDDDNGTTDATRKRQKSEPLIIDAGQTHVPHGLDPSSSLSPAPCSRPHVGTETHAAAADNPLSSPPSPDESEKPNVKSLRHKRAGTPPLRLKIPPTGAGEAEAREGQGTESLEENDSVVDPIRAALTWQEDEITVYDPEDEDDDGTGVNGIGFRPTPELAHSRAMRRRQQMADYRKREEGEARTKRTQRRSGEEPLSARPKKKLPARKVQFIDPERQHMAVTTR
ncbi:hypothetical protein C2857_001325 [Epichloe festucae Fl1]|uniref:Uncharacterized protein n=1 Tax=Epichloe festucae (strain Fl1) TaxID=877507 RepID=A0A7S9KK99_EPIFF|nr:hypothetical protein C2857_001325 [Epichloe festucae Fl1]